MTPPFHSLSYLLPPLVTLVSSIGLAAVVYLWGRKGFSSRLFVYLLLSIGLWGLLIFSMRSSPDLERALFWDRLLPPATTLTFVLFYHFSRAYTRTGKQKYLVLASYLFLLTVVAISPTSLGVESMRVEDYGYAPNIGSAAYPIFMVFPLLTAGGVYNLIKGYRSSLSDDERNRLLYLMVGALFLLLGIFLDALTNLPPMAIWTNLIFSVICSIAILRYHLLDIRVIIRKSLVYLLVSFVIALPYVGVIFLVSQIIRGTREPWWIHAVIIFIIAIFMRPLYTWSQRLVDRLFYRDRYNYLIALEDFIQETHDIRNLNRLASSLANLMSRALQASPVWLLLSTDSGDFVNIHPEDTSSLPVLGSGGPLLRWLNTNKSILNHKQLAIIPQLQSLTSNELDVLNQARAEIIVPLLTKDNNLVGLILIGGKLSQMEYSADDERLIMAVARRMATELENARLYESERIMRKEIEKQDQLKTEFLHSVAHELKTPLTALISSSELLCEESSIADALRKRLYNNIRESAWSMNRRVNELLDLARLQIGELRIEPEPLEIGRTITESSSKLLILFENKKQKFTLEIAGALPAVNADKEKLEQILFNLLSNANKFSPIGSDIVLRAREADGIIIIETEDSAAPVTEEEKLKLFNPYYRGENIDKRERFPGIGLGLAITKKLVELHNGKIWVETSPGKGNIFAFSIPALAVTDNQQGNIVHVTGKVG